MQSGDSYTESSHLRWRFRDFHYNHIWTVAATVAATIHGMQTREIYRHMASDITSRYDFSEYPFAYHILSIIHVIAKRLDI